LNHFKQPRKRKKTAIKKPAVFIILASPFAIDPRVKQEFGSLLKKGFYVKLLSWDRDGNNSDERTANYHIKYVKLLRSKTFSKILFLLSALLFQFVAFFEGLKLLQQVGKFLVHANDFNTFLGALFLKFFFPRKIKVIYDSHELTPAVYSEWYGSVIGSIVGKFEKKIVKRFDALIGVSPPIVSHLKAIAGREKNVYLIWNYPSQVVIPSLTKPQARQALGLPQDAFLLTYVGTLRTDVALLELIDVLSALKQQLRHEPTLFSKKFKVIIVGDGPLYDELVHRISERKLEEFITIVGRVPRKTSLIYLRASDLSYILFKIKGMNTKIGMPWKLFESLVCGTKVLVLEKTYAATFVKNHTAGYTITTLDPPFLAKKLISIMQSQTEFNNSFDFLWEQQETLFIKIYSELYQKFL